MFVLLQARRENTGNSSPMSFTCHVVGQALNLAGAVSLQKVGYS